MKKWIAVIALTALGLVAQDKRTTEPIKIAGAWTMNLDTPHGPVEGPLQLKQDGATVTGTFEAENFGTMPVTGTLDGKKIEITLEVVAAQMKFKLSGTVDDKGMSGSTEMGGGWKAARK